MGIILESFEIKGTDVSENNGVIDFITLSKYFDFGAIRLGFGKVEDDKFTINWAESKYKINRIPYWYLDYYSNHILASPVNGVSDKAWGEIQAEKCWAMIKNDPAGGTVFLDIENGNPKYAKPLDDPATKKQAQAIAKAFLVRLDQLNQKQNGIYASMGWLVWFGEWFRDRPLWVAWYNESRSVANVRANVLAAGWTGPLLIWQYASDGDIDDDGVPDGVRCGTQYRTLDLNGWLGSKQQYYDLVGITITPPPEDPQVPPEEPETETTWQVLATKLNMRVKPDKTSKGLGYYLAGAPVAIDQIIGNWGHVSGQQYFICLKDAGTVLAVKIV